MYSKKWYQSSIVWIGILGALGSSCDVIVQMLQSGGIDSGSVLVAAGALAVIWRRFKTDTPIELSH